MIFCERCFCDEEIISIIRNYDVLGECQICKSKNVYTYDTDRFDDLSGLFVLFIDIILKQPIGFGTLLDIMIIGKTTDLFLSFEFIPQITSLPLAIILLITSLFIQSFGVYLYTSAGLSVGPRDAMLIAIAKKSNHMSIGTIKAIIEISVFIIGFMLGAPVGIGTLICVFGIGFILQFTLKIFHLDLRKVKQESLLETTVQIFSKQKVYE